MKDGIVGILPALLENTVAAFAGIFDKTVTVYIAIFVDPFKGLKNIGPDLFYKFKISGSPEIGFGKNNKKRGRICAAVVVFVRNFSECGHFTCSAFVQNLPRLGIVGNTGCLGLPVGEKTKNAASQARVYPEGLKGCDDAVPAERSTEPGDAGIGISAECGLGCQHLQVGH